MKLTEKKLPEGKVALTAHASAKEVEDAFATAYLAFVNNTGLKPEQGKTVNQVVEEQLGIKDLDSHVRNQALEALIPYAIDKSGLLPAFPPAVTECSALHRGSEVAFTLELTPKIHYELSSYEPVEVTVPKFEMDTTLIDRQIEEIAKRNIEYVRAADQDRAVKAEDAVLLEMESYENGKRNTGLSSAARTYVCGKGFMPQGFDEQIIGMRPGETKTFTFEGPDVDAQGNETTTTVETTATVIELQQECVPAITDAWLARNMPVFKTVDELREDIGKSLERQTREQYDNQCRQLAVFQLADRFEGKIPDEAYEAMRDNLLTEMRAQAKAQKMEFKDFVEKQGGEQQFSMMVMMQVREMLVEGYVLDALFNHEGLKVADEDLDEAARQINPKADPAQTRKMLENTGRKFILRETAERYVASRYLMEHAKVTVAA